MPADTASSKSWFTSCALRANLRSLCWTLPPENVPRPTGGNTARSRWARPAAPELLCHGPLLQPHDVYRVHPLASHGAVPELPPPCAGVFWWICPQSDDRQPEGGSGATSQR